MTEPIDLRLKPPCDRNDALTILKRLRQAGHVAYFAGGCVRDTLLGLTPKDYDIATDAPPARVRELFSNTQAVGAAFGVILVRLHQSVIEIATFRADGVYSDGRRPDEVHFTNAEEDAKRRDFTINGLFFDPIENKVIDYVGGQADLRDHLLRAIGDAGARFNEDHLRLLRAVRFAARFNFEIEPATAAAIRSAAPRLKGISPERIGDELRLMLAPSTRHKVWKLLWDLRIAPEIFRFLPLKADFILDMNRSLFLAIPAGENVPFALALAAMTLHVRSDREVLELLQKKEIQKSTAAMRQALRISNEESDQMSELLAAIAPLLSVQSPPLATKRRFLAQPTSSLSRILMNAMLKLGIHSERISSLSVELAKLDGQDNNPAPLLTGDDLISAGLQPGPKFKAILDAVYDAQLENTIATKQEAIEMAMKSRS